MRQATEDWLVKGHSGGEEIDLIFELARRPVDASILNRAEVRPVDSVRMPVLAPTDLMDSRLAALCEHYCDFGGLLPTARMLRERIDRDRLRDRYGQEPMPARRTRRAAGPAVPGRRAARSAASCGPGNTAPGRARNRSPRASGASGVRRPFRARSKGRSKSSIASSFRTDLACLTSSSRHPAALSGAGEAGRAPGSGNTAVSFQVGRWSGTACGRGRVHRHAAVGPRSAHPRSRRRYTARGATLPKMERSEILKRVIGILTEAQDIRRAVETGQDDAGPDATAGVATLLLNEMLPPIKVPADASPQQVATVVAEALGPALHTMVSGFSLAFTSLAIAHDNGHTEISSVEVLQQLALEVEAGTYDEGS